MKKELPIEYIVRKTKASKHAPNGQYVCYCHAIDSQTQVYDSTPILALDRYLETIKRKQNANPQPKTPFIN